MTKEQENKIRKDWEDSELNKRIGATEMFAITHGFPEWTSETIPDWWLTKMKEQIETAVRERIKDAYKLKKGLIYVNKNNSQIFSEYYNEAIDDVVNLLSTSPKE